MTNIIKAKHRWRRRVISRCRIPPRNSILFFFPSCSTQHSLVHSIIINQCAWNTEAICASWGEKNNKAVPGPNLDTKRCHASFIIRSQVGRFCWVIGIIIKQELRKFNNSWGCFKISVQWYVGKKSDKINAMLIKNLVLEFWTNYNRWFCTSDDSDQFVLVVLKNKAPSNDPLAPVVVKSPLL
jgi:hypothetical protein